MNNITVSDKKDLPGSQKQLKVVVSKEFLQQTKKETFESVRKEATLPGFRKGKVPDNLIETKFQKELETQTFDNALQNATIQALNETELYPLSTPQVSINEYKPDEALEYTLVFSVYPSVKIGNVKNIKIKVQKLSEEEQKLPEAERFAKENEYKQLYYSQLIAEALKLMETDVPQLMIDDEEGHIEQNFNNKLKQLNITPENYLQARGITHEDQHVEWKKEATFIIKQQLFLTQFAKDQDIAVTDEEINSEIGKLDASLRELYSTGNNRLYVAQLIKNQKAFNRLVEITGGQI